MLLVYLGTAVLAYFLTVGVLFAVQASDPWIHGFVGMAVTLGSGTWQAWHARRHRRNAAGS
ncbi:hypothetical protein ACQPXB_08215 [Amycolatopsis sp. CA-161197]|uniref:hypothetical protein n=1 Tax=Amycolatopsis sp. CA-161197 TaxID=3239922 RepID=UPI003D8EF7D3